MTKSPAELAHRVLRRRYTVGMSTYPTEALERLLAMATVDLVISDVMMRPLTGVELQSRVVAARTELAGRFLFMTGGAIDDATKRYLEALPPQMLLLKPFSSLDLERAVGSALGSFSEPLVKAVEG